MRSAEQVQHPVLQPLQRRRFVRAQERMGVELGDPFPIRGA